MKLLWIVNIVLPRAAHLIDSKPIAFGGWVSQMVNQLSADPQVQLSVVTKTSLVKTVQKHQLENVTYYFVPESSMNRYDANEHYCAYVLSDCNPDLLHAEGTEQQFTYRMLTMWKGKNIVSMQGIINGYEPYEFGNLPIEKLLFSLNPSKVIFALSMLVNKRFRFKPRLKFEAETIGLAQHIFGRTLWDKAHAFALNPRAPYFHCSRTLRPSFYKNFSKIESQPYSLFIGNASNPRKGAHFVIEALALLKTDFPEIKLYVAGNSPFPKSWKDWKKKIGYPNYLLGLIQKHKLEKHVIFTGILAEEEMATKMAEMSAYIMPSTIENSPNTLGEAMMLGVPCISAVTGGTPQMAKDEEEALFYRDNDSKLLAYQIRRVFIDATLRHSLSEQGRKRAHKNHDSVKNFQDLMAAYHSILT
jgi:glycosyltransferase involved in cell wall biosynthesis